MHVFQGLEELRGRGGKSPGASQWTGLGRERGRNTAKEPQRAALSQAAAGSARVARAAKCARGLVRRARSGRGAAAGPGGALGGTKRHSKGGGHEEGPRTW